MPPPGGEGKRGRDTKVSLPLLTPQPFLWTRLPSVARLKTRGPQGRLVLQGHILDRSGAFRSRTLPLCTVWPRTVMRGGLRKVNSGHNSIPKSARRTEPSPRNPRLAANASLSGLKEGLGCQEGKGNHRGPFPSCLRRQTAAPPPPWVRRSPARRQQLSLRIKQKHRLKVDAFTSGAADEARTRYHTPQKLRFHGGPDLGLNEGGGSECASHKNKGTD